MTTDVVRVSGDYVIDAANGNITLIASGSQQTGTVTILGNLSVMGVSSQIQTLDSTISDNIIVLNSGETNSFVSMGSSGIMIARGNQDNPAQAASLLYRDNENWTDINGLHRGIYQFQVAGVDSAIRVGAIRTSSTSTRLNFLGSENSQAVLSVHGTVDYHRHVVDDNDIPNKKYVDVALFNGTNLAQKLIVGKTFVGIGDNSVDFDNPYYSAENKIYAALGTSTNVVFNLEGTTAQVQGITINGNVITAIGNRDTVIASTAAGARVLVKGTLSVQHQAVVPTSSATNISFYSTSTTGGGGTGFKFVNGAVADELASRRRAIVYGLIF